MFVLGKKSRNQETCVVRVLGGGARAQEFFFRANVDRIRTTSEIGVVDDSSRIWRLMPGTKEST